MPIVDPGKAEAAYPAAVSGRFSLEVYVTPPPPAVLAGAAAIVVDILRATTVHDALITGRVDRVYPVGDFPAGIALRAGLTGAKLIGEIGALPPPEANYGNSPTEFADSDVRGWTVVHVTSNGTRALLGAGEAMHVLSGCLRNLSASVEQSLNQNTERLAIVCSGDHGGTAPSIEDTFAAGAYVSAFRQRLPDLNLHGGARLALKLYEAYGRNPLTAFADSPHADHLRKLKFDADLTYAAKIDASTSTALLEQDNLGRPYLRPA